MPIKRRRRRSRVGWGPLSWPEVGWECWQSNYTVRRCCSLNSGWAASQPDQPLHHRSSLFSRIAIQSVSGGISASLSSDWHFPLCPTPILCLSLFIFKLTSAVTCLFNILKLIKGTSVQTTFTVQNKTSAISSQLKWPWSDQYLQEGRVWLVEVWSESKSVGVWLHFVLLGDAFMKVLISPSCQEWRSGSEVEKEKNGELTKVWLVGVEQQAGDWGLSSRKRKRRKMNVLKDQGGQWQCGIWGDYTFNKRRNDQR